MKIKIDSEACIGASACIAAAGHTFALNEAGKSQVINATGDDPEAIQAAAQACPTQAIEIIDED